MILATANGHTATAEWLLSHGASITERDNNGWTTLLHAASTGHTATVEWLLGHGASILERNNYDETALLWAAYNGQTATAEWLLSHGARIDEKRNDGATALLAAAYNGQTATAEWLLSHGASITERDNNGWTAIDIARKQGHDETAAFLECWQKYLEAQTASTGFSQSRFHLRVQITPPTLSKATYLKAAEAPNNEPYAQYKVGQCCEAERSTVEALSWYQKAAENYHRPYEPARTALERLQKELRSEAKAEAKLVRSNPQQKASEAKEEKKEAKREQKLGQIDLNRNLLAAAENSDLAAIKYWQGKGADVNTTEGNAEKINPLLWVIRKGNFEATSFLLPLANLTAQDQYGNGLLQTALFFQDRYDPRIVELLLKRTPVDKKLGAVLEDDDKKLAAMKDAKVNLESIESSGYSLLHYAAARGKLKTVQWLTTNLPKLISLPQKISGVTPLLLAARNGQINTLERLLRSGANIHERSANGWTALLYAARNGHTETLVWLLNHGANIADRNNGGYTAFLCAVYFGHTETARWLLNHRANILDRNTRGQSAIDIARENHHAATVTFLEEWQKQASSSPSAASVSPPLAISRPSASVSSAEEKSKREKAENENAENEKIARELKERQEKEAKKKEEKADQKHPEVKTESKSHEVKAESDVKAIVDPAVVKSLVDEVGRQKSIIERLEEAKHEPLLDTKTLTEKEQELDDLSHNMARVTGTTLKLLQDRAAELRQVITRQTELNNKELELKIIKGDDALSDYYYTVLILLTDCVSACKVTHAKVGPASLANSKMNMDDYVVSLMKAIGGNIPVLSMFTNALAGVHGFISSRGKLEQINLIVRFLPTTTDGDQFVETLARRLTFAQERELKAIPAAQVGLIKRAIRAGKNFKCWLTADDNNNPVRQLANQHCESCLAQVIGGQFTIPATLSDIPRMVIAILGKRPVMSQTPSALEMPRDAPQSSACSLSSFFVRAASSSQTEVSPAPSDNQVLIASLLAEQERIRKTIADNEKLAKEASEKAEQAEKASREAKADTSKIKKAITGLGLTVAGDNSAQVYASASANPDSATSFEDLAKENAELRDRLQELETRMGIALERMEQHGSDISGLASRVYRRH